MPRPPIEKPLPERPPDPAAADLSNPADRESLSPSALHAFFKIKEFWKISDHEARELLGVRTTSDISALKRGNQRTLDEDELRRIASLLEIFVSLNSLYSDTDTADKWIRMPNNDRFFGGKAPLSFMIQGGLEAFRKVEGYLDPS